MVNSTTVTFGNESVKINLVSLHRVTSISFHKCLQHSACKEGSEKLAEVKMYTIYKPAKLPHHIIYFIMVVAFVCFVALDPKSTAMIMAGQSVHLTTLFPGQA